MAATDSLLMTKLFLPPRRPILAVFELKKAVDENATILSALQQPQSYKTMSLERLTLAH